MRVTDNLTDAAVINESYEYFDHLRETDPVHRNEKLGGWVVTRYDDFRQYLQDDEHLSVKTETDRLRNSLLDLPETTNMFPKWVLYLDPPDHTELRRIIGEAFNPDIVAGQHVKVETVTETLIEDIKRRNSDEIELIEEFAYPSPVRVVTRIMGLSLEDEE